MSGYFTISKSSEGLYKEKGSKFISFLFPVEFEVSVELCLDKVRADHAKSRHVCYAYRMGPEAEYIRFNDAGEPKNSAGMPILNQLRSANLTDVLLVVVRYFGGTKLGLSGLTTAYKEAARSAIEGANLQPYVRKETLRFTFAYAEIGEVMRIVEQQNLEIKEALYSEPCKMEASVDWEKLEKVKTILSAINSLQIS